MRHLRPVVALACALALVGCGAKTGLLIPDASLDAGMDAGTDAGRDSGMCEPRPFELERRGAQIMFVIDRSNSMEDALDGSEADPGERRWDLVALILDDVLNDADRLLELGAKFYPRWTPTDPGTPEEACTVAGGIDIEPARGRTGAILEAFATTYPQGGTPTAEALRQVRDYFAGRPVSAVPRYVVLATDGGPNCNPDTGVHHTRCLCTGAPDMCLDDRYGPYNCIDDRNAYAVIDELFGALGIPVYVIGIDDPTRPDLADVLDEMAVRGGRPREVMPGERRFYSVREPADLRGAFTTITDSISRCVFSVRPTPGAADEVTVRIGDVFVPRDPTRSEGWDFTSPDRRELTLFGGACERVAATGDEVIAEVPCPPDEE